MSPLPTLPRMATTLLVGLLGVTSATAASAASFDARGKAHLDAAYGLGFEAGDALPTYLAWTFGGAEEATPPVRDDADGLEGVQAFAFGGDVRRGLMRIEQPELAGRRVELTLWYLPRGTDVKVALRWMTGDIDAYLDTGDREAALTLGELVLTPSGRATSDGWLELTSGPVDWSLGGELAPAWLSFNNPQHDSYLYRSRVHDSDAVALIDAVEIHDLGPAAVPADTRCTVVEEASTCGDHGVCFLGRCVDAAAVLGAPPSGDVRAQYLARRSAEVSLFSAVRQGQARMDEIRDALAGLQEVGVRDFWTGFGQAHELLVDGHGSPPRGSSFYIYNTNDTCLGPGRADLLPGASAELAPMVFSTRDPRLQPGDVLARIDGVDVDTWADSAPRYFYYNGDVDGRKAQRGANLLGPAMLTGATVEFERCPRSAVDYALPCAPGEVQTIVIDFAESFGAGLWAGQVPTDFYDADICDMRFSARVASPLDRTDTFYEFADWVDVDGIRHLVFNGFPGPQTHSGAAWKQSFQEALSTAPPMVAIDQRTGWGGQIEGVEFLAGQLLDPDNAIVALLYPWLDEVLSTELELAFESCMSGVRIDPFSCGNHYAIAPTGSGAARDARVALINGYDVSGNDYFARFVSERSAPTRIFGYAPTIGAYGVSCQFAPLVWELQTMAYQCHDTLFVGADGSHDGFESGYGVEADEYVYQTMSDAIRGEDTILAAAEAWLQQGGEQP